MAATAALLGLVALADDEQSSTGRDLDCCWRSGTTPEWMSKRMGVRIPSGASDARAGFQAGSRYDIGILSFTLPNPKADAYLTRLVPGDQEMIGNDHPKEKADPSMGPFSHLGLPDPETLTKGLKKASFCPGGATTPEGKHLRYCVDIFAHTFTPGQQRLYFRSFIEPRLDAN
ncbi:hypothetical protein [Streptomyces palmae]|uniref:Uncharacterized protein n=1 Tax=Streptomyces palmae TaxID=1701085 RepID=A0A4Z0GYX5_9ACTN|nr:hypothetical protein [Streptomyces palmae]TGB03179.1 hypothetical protein E4099_19890 [Streptomyces palmae]